MATDRIKPRRQRLNSPWFMTPSACPSSNYLKSASPLMAIFGPRLFVYESHTRFMPVSPIFFSPPPPPPPSPPPQKNNNARVVNKIAPRAHLRRTIFLSIPRTLRARVNDQVACTRWTTRAASSRAVRVPLLDSSSSIARMRFSFSRNSFPPPPPPPPLFISNSQRWDLYILRNVAQDKPQLASRWLGTREDACSALEDAAAPRTPLENSANIDFTFFKYLG